MKKSKVENPDKEHWVVGEPGGPAGPFYSVVSEHGRVIAMQVPEKATAILICQIPDLCQLRYEWADVINLLARMIIDGPNSNDRDYAEDMIDMVLPYLSGSPHV